ncbi:hypothetical protein FS837_002996 [Tulasnella sp. UAMH 9824]|nr:hypothetical protein FS837_002996 [Tulasnella sp. UAMH 9824]
MDGSEIADAIDHVKSGESPVEIIWSSHPRWPQPESTGTAAGTSATTLNTFRISVLDSSFNPPTLAHKALALSPYPGESREDIYQAHLLLLSVRNADKVLKQGDATYVQRVEMMVHLAEDVVQYLPAQLPPNVAVAVIDEPSFVGKSTKLHAYLRPRLPDETQVKLIFVLGTDTITRFFTPRFYPSQESMLRSIERFFWQPSQGGEGSEIVCARRASTLTPQEEQEFLQTDEVKQWVGAGAVKMIDIGEEEAKMSSTSVREGLRYSPGSANPNESPSLESMCCPKVAKYIKDQFLYGLK